MRKLDNELYASKFAASWTLLKSFCHSIIYN